MGTTIAIVVFYALADIVLLASLVSSCLIRKPRVYQKAIAFKSLFVSILGSIVEISALVGTLLALLLGHAPYHTIAWMFNLFIGNLQYILIPNVLYRLIQAYTGNLKGYGRGRERCLLVKVHRIILTTLVILYLADIIIGFLIRYTVIPATNQKWEPGPAEKLWLAKRTVQFLVSLEIIVEMVILVRLPKKVSSQKGTVTCTIGAFFFLLLSLISLVAAIEGYKHPQEMTAYQFPDSKEDYEDPQSDGLSKTFRAVEPFFRAIFTIGIYPGLIYCCMQWHKIDPRQLGVSLSTEEERSQMLPRPKLETHEI